MEQRVQNVIGGIGAVLILAGVGMYVTPLSNLSPYVYSLGAVLFAIPQLAQRYDGKNLIIRRLHRQQMLGAMLLLMTAVFMFWLEHNEWLLSLTIAAVLELYTAFRIPQEEAKEKE